MATKDPIRSGLVKQPTQLEFQFGAGTLAGRNDTTGGNALEEITVGTGLTITGSTLENTAPADAYIDHLLNGATVESASIVLRSTGTKVFLDLEKTGGGDLNFYFDGDPITLDCTPTLAIALTAGTDNVPVHNFVWIINTAGVLSASTGTDWPTGIKYAPVATVLVQSAASVLAYGGYKVHAWTDHLDSGDENGHLAHLNRKIRAIGATWVSGVAPSYASGQFDTTAGEVYQLHPHDMPAIQMSTGAVAYIANEPTTTYKRVTSINSGGISQDASGDSLVNGKYYNIVLWGVVSESDGDCQLFLNLPTSYYTVAASAIADDAVTSVYSFGSPFIGCAFLIARYTMQYSSAGAGSFSSVQLTDLRGLFPSTSPGGGSLTDHGNLSGLTDDDHTQYSQKANNLSDLTDATVARANLNVVAQDELENIWWTDFDVTGTQPNGWSAATSGGSIAGHWDKMVNTTENGVGVIELLTGTGTTGRYALCTYNDKYFPGTAELSFSARVCPEDLSTGSEAFAIQVGFGASVHTTTTPNQGATFLYDPSTYGDDNWRCLTKNTGSTTTTDTGVAALAASFQVLLIVINAEGTSIAFYIDDALVATHTTNLPNSRMGLAVGIYKSAGTTTRAVFVDWTRRKILRSSAR